MDVVALQAAKADAAKNYEAWSLVSSRPVKTGDAATTTTYQASTTRLSEVAPYALVAVRLVYANWQFFNSAGEGPNYGAIRVKAAVHRAGTSAPDRATTDPLHQVFFAGREFGTCLPGGFLISDRIPVPVAAGERWWHESYADTYLGAGPSAPTLTLSAGSALAIGTTYYVAVTYVYPDGTESLPSAESSIVPTSGQQNITVTAPAATPGVIGYRVYMGSGAGANQMKYEHPTWPMAPLGTNIVLAGTVAGTNLYRQIRDTGHIGLPVGRGTLAGAGENNISGRDYTTSPVAIAGAGSYAGYFSPIAVLGLAADGRVHRSVALIGDSIQAGTGDYGYGGGLGGFAFRACANQSAQIPFDSTKTPKLGFMQLAQGGETVATFVTAAGGSRRRFISEYATSILDEYGINDTGNGSAPLYASLLANLTYYSGRKRYFQTTLSPNNRSSTDGYKTVANQTVANTDQEADRRAINNCVRGTTGTVAVTGEALFRSPGTATPATVLTGGDGTTVKFYTAFPFRTGTETVQVGGVTKTVTTDYTYRQTAVINGITYASGVSFVTAPANLATVTASYTKVASFGSLAGYSGYFDKAAPVEVNAAGALTANGGWWAPAVNGVGTTGTASASAASSLTDGAASWTVDQWRGMTVRITADAGTPAAVGLINAIQSNTATVLTLGNAWTTTPSATASYEIVETFTIDGTHPSSYAHMLMAGTVDTSKL